MSEADDEKKRGIRVVGEAHVGNTEVSALLARLAMGNRGVSIMSEADDEGTGVWAS